LHLLLQCRDDNRFALELEETGEARKRLCQKSLSTIVAAATAILSSYICHNYVILVSKSCYLRLQNSQVIFSQKLISPF